MERLFLQPEDRQREVEFLCDGQFPGFIRPTRTRPLVVKLHGDHRLSPQNTEQETERLKRDIEKHVRSLLHDRGLIFIGCGGHDRGIKKMLETLPQEALALGVYWVSGREPHGVIRPWLEARNAVWVEKGDFDELMLLIRDVFDVSHPDRGRFEEVFEKYTETYKNLSQRITALPDTVPGAPALKEAIERTDESFPDWRSVYLAASRVEKNDPDRADLIYKRGTEQFPNSAPLLGTYALFLMIVRKDYDRAEEYYRRALEAEPDRTSTLGNYARFRQNVRKDYDGAEEYYRRALNADPNNAANLGAFAIFLKNVRKDYDGAEEYYRRALDADPNDVTNLGNYAIFLENVRKDYHRAEEYYRRAVDAEPNHAGSLANLAGLLLALGRSEEGLEVLTKALGLPDASEPSDFSAEAWFYALAHRPQEGREEALRCLKSVLEGGARSFGWDLQNNVAQARHEEHPDIDWLEKVAAVITQGADIRTLDDWPAWRDA